MAAASYTQLAQSRCIQTQQHAPGRTACVRNKDKLTRMSRAGHFTISSRIGHEPAGGQAAHINWTCSAEARANTCASAVGPARQQRLNIRCCDTIASTSPRAASSSTMRLHNVVGRLHAAGLPNPRAGVEAAAARQVLTLPPSTRRSGKKTPCRQCCVASTPACRRSGSGIAQAVAMKEVLMAQASLAQRLRRGSP